VYIIFWWLFTKFEYVMFHHRIVSTRVVGRCSLTVSKPVLKLESAYGFSA